MRFLVLVLRSWNEQDVLITADSITNIPNTSGLRFQNTLRLKFLDITKGGVRRDSAMLCPVLCGKFARIAIQVNVEDVPLTVRNYRLGVGLPENGLISDYTKIASRVRREVVFQYSGLYSNGRLVVFVLSASTEL